MTTIPDRIAHIEPCVTSLLAQGLPVYVWAVAKIARSETRLETVPGFLTRCGAHVQIVPDRGPITKLLPALERGLETIITADDDCIYGPGWAAGLLEWHEQLGGAVGYMGRRLGSARAYGKSAKLKRVKVPVEVDILLGVEGVLYRAEMFDGGIFDEWRRCPTNDDLVISAHLKRRGVVRRVVPHPPGLGIANTDLRHVERLSKGNNAGLSDEGLRALGLLARKR